MQKDLNISFVDNDTKSHAITYFDNQSMCMLLNTIGETQVNVKSQIKETTGQTRAELKYENPTVWSQILEKRNKIFYTD